MIVKLEQDENGDGSRTMKKKVPTQIVMVDTVLTYRMRYAVEIPGDAADIQLAVAKVSNSDAVEFSQLYLGELISSHQLISKEQFLEQFDLDNNYLVAWTDEQKFKAGLTKLDAE